MPIMQLKAFGRQMQRLFILISASFGRSKEIPVIAWRVYSKGFLTVTNPITTLSSSCGRAQANSEWRLSASHSLKNGGSAHSNYPGVGTRTPSLRMTGCRTRQVQQDNLRQAQVDHGPAAGRIEDLALKHAYRKSMFSLQ